MASGYPLATFFHERCTAKRSSAMFTGDVHVQMLLPLFEQLLRLHLPNRTLHITLSNF